LDAGLTALSFAGEYLLGGRLNQLEDSEDGAPRNIAGYRSRAANEAHMAFFRKNVGWNRNVGMIFDTFDVALTYQGLPAAAGWKAILSTNLQELNLGHSLGASEMNTLDTWGVTRNSSVYALPFGRASSYGTSVTIGNRDPVNGFSLGKLLNPWATLKKVKWFGHGYEDNYKP
jgi:hypothetical protein